jgi:hypothetical protein
MINLPTVPASVTNETTATAVLSPLGTIDASLDNETTVLSPVDNIPLPNARIEGLWVASVFPWDIKDIWSYESVAKSNVPVTNL